MSGKTFSIVSDVQDDTAKKTQGEPGTLKSEFSAKIKV